MPIVIGNTTNLAPEKPLGTQSVAVDGLGSTFVVWKHGPALRVQIYNRNNTIVKPWFTSFTIPATATGDHIALCPFASGGCAIVYATTPILGNAIRYEYIDKNGLYVFASSGSFPANFDPAFPQFACTTNAKDELAVVFATINNQVKAQIIQGMPQRFSSLIPIFQVNSAPIALQTSITEHSLLGVTTNWIGSSFATLYIRRSDGNGLIRKFSELGPITAEVDTQELFRECPAGGANRGLPFISMCESSDKLLLVNPVIPTSSSNPPTQLRVRVYNETITATFSVVVINNPMSTNYKLNCIGGGFLASGNSVFAINDDTTNLNIFYLDPSGGILDIKTNITASHPFVTEDAIAPSATAAGGTMLVGYYDETLQTSFLTNISLSQERLIRSYGTRPTEILSTPGLDNDATLTLTNVNTQTIPPQIRPNNSLNAFIGQKDLVLVGGPSTNTASFQLFADRGPLKAEFDQTLTSLGILGLSFANIHGNGLLFDNRNGSTNNAPRILITNPYGSFVMAKHRIGTTAYDYAILLRIHANRDLYMFAGIRDISTNAAARNILFPSPNLDNPLENFSAVLLITTYPDSVTTVADYQNALGSGLATIAFKPMIGIRENSPLN